MNVYHHKWFPRIFYKKPDGGKDSGVTGYFLIEWKCLFSIALLHFTEGSREAYHSHAFNAFTWWLTGEATEVKINQETYEYCRSWKPKYTPRNNCHKVVAQNSCWALTIRGPWKDYWYEWRDGNMVTLTHGRKGCIMKFYLTSEQLAKIADWMDSLPEAPTGAIGGRFTYEFTPTSLGLVTKVTDCITKETIDISNYEEW